MEKALNTADKIPTINALRPIFKNSLQTQQELMRVARQKGELPNIPECYFVLVAREDFHNREKLSCSGECLV